MKLIAAFGIVGVIVAVMETAGEPVTASQFNVYLNMAMILLMSAMGWGLRTFASRILTKIDLMNAQLIKVCTTVELRDGQQEQINQLTNELNELRVEFATFSAKEHAPSRRTR